jgi:hypothetical protein
LHRSSGPSEAARSNLATHSSNTRSNLAATTRSNSLLLTVIRSNLANIRNNLANIRNNLASIRSNPANIRNNRRNNCRLNPSSSHRIRFQGCRTFLVCPGTVQHSPIRST